MEKYDVNNHLFYDGYNLDNKVIGDPTFVNDLLKEINKNVFEDKGKIQLLPYFNGKVKTDGGVSGIILGNGFHFTCHTFSYKNTVFVDYFGDNEKKDKVLEILLNYFDTDDYDLGSKDKVGNFGKHIIVRSSAISFSDAEKLVKTILKEIDMTPITDLIVNKTSEYSFDVLQPIAESHISIHRNGDEMVIDAFSCKYFDVLKFIDLIGKDLDYIEVNRGLKYRG